jgi:uncharacterized protein
MKNIAFEPSKPWAAALRRGLLACVLGAAAPAMAQTPPSAAELAAYQGLFAAAARGDAAQIKTLAAGGAPLQALDANGRTPLHVAAFRSQLDAMRALVTAGANPNALDAERYDIVTIAAVANDLPTLQLALALGGSAKNITSRYDGTALIASAHLGYPAVVRALIQAGAPLDHVNNLGWTAVIESIVLGDGGARHQEVLQALIAAKANLNLPDRQGRSPLTLARERGYQAMVRMLEQAGAK